MQTTPSPLAKHTNGAYGFQHMSHSTPETSMYGGNCYLTNHAYQGTQNRRYTYHTAPFTSSHTDHDQWGFHHRGLPRSSNWFHRTYPCEYSNNVFHASNTTASNLETPPHAREMVYKGNVIEQSIIQAALAYIEMYDGTKNWIEAWTKSIKCSINIRSKCNMHTFL